MHWKKLGLLFGFCVCSWTYAATQEPVATIHTTHGDIKIELLASKAPITVKNFIRYAKSGFYKNVIFHRAIPDFIIQAGDVTVDKSPRQNFPPIKNEAKNGLHNVRGSVAMARPPDIDGATSHFFINLKDNLFLDHSEKDYGYAVFGRVIKGMDVVDAIAKAPAKNELPITPIIITGIDIQ